MRHTIYLSATLAILWLLNSGHYTPMILGLGALSIAGVVWLANAMDVVDRAAKPLHLSLRLPLYWLWLVKEIVLSNIDVAKRVWIGPSTIDPQIARFKISQQTDVGRVLYANSITLTPGTVTLDLREDEVLVHALSKVGIDGLASGEMDRRVRRLEE